MTVKDRSAIIVGGMFFGATTRRASATENRMLSRIREQQDSLTRHPIPTWRRNADERLYLHKRVCLRPMSRQCEGPSLMGLPIPPVLRGENSIGKGLDATYIRIGAGRIALPGTKGRNLVIRLVFLATSKTVMPRR